MKVLIAEDNAHIREQLSTLLEKEGYQTVQAPNGDDALAAYAREKPDFICVDIMMPGKSGYDVCREIRAHDPHTPVIFISAKSNTIDKVLALEIGADDYIVKPFDIYEVTARIRAVTRRCINKEEPGRQDESFDFGPIRVFPQQLRGEKNNQSIDFSLREIRILSLFHKNRGNVIDRDTLLDHCWGTHIMPESRTVDWHISQLRKKVEDDPLTPVLIKTIHGAGYKFDPS